MQEKDLERFLSHVKIDEESGCWLWTASKDKKGYGKFSYGPRCTWVPAHRASYFHYKNPNLDPGLCILHQCNNPSCVNPSHLGTGTRIDNNVDMIAKGRHHYPNSGSLDKERVIEIRKKLWQGKQLSDLAGEYGVSEATISYIKSGKTWKDAYPA
jgi:hypothetical protein